MSKRKVGADWEVLISVKIKNLVAHNEPDAETLVKELISEETILALADLKDMTIVKLRPLVPQRKKKVVSIELPWPERVLHPNSRAHRMVVSSRKKIARVRARREMEQALAATRLPRKPEGEKYQVSLLFHPPTLKRNRDEDGMLSSMKAALDGISDAMGVDDSNFKVITQVCDARGDGLVVVMVE